ncbi:Tether containing UBX domain for GLUT4 [Borealophlyctis nickersoniae]|nr:Tether containing UBX domain for GLUT4 [Borealophlyctis nickersoniae]
MSLRSIVETAVAKWNLGSPDGWGLKKAGAKGNAALLDMSLSVRFANLAPGAKLTLVKVKPVTVGGGLVTVALQSEDGGRLMGKFPTSTSLWDILVHFEKEGNGTVNLTSRAGVPPTAEKNAFVKAFAKKGQPVYMMPVCIFMNQEYSTIESLRTTTLQKAGLTSGNGVIRLLFRFTDMALEAAMEEVRRREAIGKDEGGATPMAVDQAGPVSATSPPQVSPEVPPATSAPPPISASATGLAPETVVAPAASVIGPGSVPTVATPAVSAPVNQNVEEKPVAFPEPTVPPPVNAPAPVEVPVFETGGVAPMDVDSAAEQAVFKDVVAGVAGAQAANAVVEQDAVVGGMVATMEPFLVAGQAAKRTASENAPLMTKAMREREAELRQAKYPKTLIRVRFSDQITLQVTFWSGEKVASLYTAVRESLATPDRPFVLYMTPPFRTLDPEVTFWKSSLAPASLVYFKWEDGDTASGGGVVLSQLRKATMEDFPVPAVNVEGGGVVPGAAVEEEDKKKGPSWLEKLEKRKNSGGHRLGGSGEGSSAGLAGGVGLFGDERDRQGGERRGSGGGGDGEKKVPKWFQIGNRK